MQLNKSSILVGAGHVGKRHAKVLSEIFEDIYIVDPNPDSLKWCKENLECNVFVYGDLSKAINESRGALVNGTALISNWGIDHANSFTELSKNGLTYFYIEKPFASSLKSIDEILSLAKENNNKLVSGFQLRHSKVVDTIKDICIKYLDSLPYMISVDGGANCLVTNGIHYLDLAFSIFGSSPLEVSSQLNMNNINPRGKHLGFWEGNANWKFNDNKLLSISFSNMSSVAITCKIFAQKGYLTISDKGPHIEILTYIRNKKEVENDPRIIRTGEVELVDSSIIKKHSLLNVVKETIIDLHNSNIEFDHERESIACKNLIYALIANDDKRTILLPFDKNHSLYNFDWPIS